MVQFMVARFPLRVLVLAAAALVAVATISPASARPSRHGGYQQSWHHTSHHQNWRHASRERSAPYYGFQGGEAARPRKSWRRASVRRSFDRSERRASRSYSSRRHVASRSRLARRDRFDRHVMDHVRPIGSDAVSLGATLNTHAALLPQDGVSTQDIPHRAASTSVSTSVAASVRPAAVVGGASLVAAARRYIGRGNPTGRKSLWCARFMNMVLQQNGFRGTGSDMASSFASYGRRLSGPQIGAIAVMSRGRRGGHVGVVSGFDRSGNPIVVSGNHSRRVAEAVYPRRRIYAYVAP